MTGVPSRGWRLGERDWTRGHGIVIDRSTLPEEDEVTDVAAWLAGRFDTLAADEFELVGDGAGSDGQKGLVRKPPPEQTTHADPHVRPSPTPTCSRAGVAEVVGPGRAAATRSTTAETS